MSQLETVISELSDNLKNHIDFEAYENFFSETYQYSLFPTGKLFRPLLVWAISQDFSKSQSFNKDQKLLASFTEVHHTYTLIHDDMPCMDDDDMRRGRASTHKKFGQWQALLSGDGLTNASYSLLAKISPEKVAHILKYATWSLGPKGLILGQALDLSGKMTESFKDLVLTHRLKTARLIQVALVGSLILTDKNDYKYDNNLLEVKSMHRLGDHMGVAFQLLDDLCELVDEKLSDHEQEVNPWPRYTKECEKQLSDSLNYIESYFNKYETKNLKNVYGLYLRKIKTLITGSESIIENHIGTNLTPILSSLDSLSS